MSLSCRRTGRHFLRRREIHEVARRSAVLVDLKQSRVGGAAHLHVRRRTNRSRALSPIVRLAGNAVRVTIENWAIARLAPIDGCDACRLRVSAVAIVNRPFASDTSREAGQLLQSMRRLARESAERAEKNARADRKCHDLDKQHPLTTPLLRQIMRSQLNRNRAERLSESHANNLA